LFETYHKSEKLSLLIKIICEVDSFKSLLKKTEGGFTHKFFQFSNKSPEKKYQENIINESSLQDYYFWMNHYLKKISKFLKNHKRSIEATNQIDFPLPPSMISDKNSSTKEKPIANFIHLFQGSGFYNLRQKFLPSDDDYINSDMEYDPITETRTYSYQDNETGEWIESKWVFKDHYLKCLNNEYRISIKNIDCYISDQTNESKNRLFLKLTLSNLKYLLTAIERNKEVNKYKASINSINALIRFIYNKYSDFIPKKMIEEYAKLGPLKIETSLPKALPPTKETETGVISLPENSVPNSNDKTVIKKSTTSCFKKMAGASKKRNIKSLFSLLEKEKYINSDSKNDFINAFTGMTPINKIKWTGLFGDIKTLINYCIEKEFIPKISNKWVVTANIFTNNGNAFINKEIKDTPTTNNEAAIKRLIDSIG
ncbi:MAG TPA: hypothetical protein PLB11_15055, partial [Flavobacterium sp.]|nr:hypothetical protein [Flavobacterium sp.]